MVQTEALMTFVIYFLLLMGLGVYFYRQTTDLEDYLIGGRGMGSWVTALSAQASDMSGWLLMGLPGAVYLGGMAETWIAIGLLLGTFFNWKLVPARLRLYTQETNTMTLPSFFEERFKDPTGLLRTITAILTLFFFTIYSSSGLVAAGRLFEAMFNIDYTTAVLVGAIVVILYTFLGGFLAVSWTDFLQGILMFCAIIIVPLLAYNFVGGADVIIETMEVREISRYLVPRGESFSVLAIISALAWGLGYFGQPHILARFMGVKSVKELPKAMTIAMVWVAISLTGAVIIGLISIPMFEGLAAGTHEKVFVYMIEELFSPWIGGVLLAAILSAIMSTIDSQLLVSSSALAEDLYKKVINNDASRQELIWIGRISVVVISLVALFLALNPENTVLGLVAYAWGGFGAAFGPVVLFALFSKQTTWKSVLIGMITGTVVLVIWKEVGLDGVLYEIVPGFIVNAVVIYLSNLFIKQDNEVVLEEYDKVITQLTDKEVEAEDPVKPVSS
ncbi:sodium/proline symporter PutP [Natroniella acetigena]|uniref:sodium/proline symporter PutP n=1 Tax=Natroniella acetigena TaxID=52004 RepID=UPI00200B0832|nr:sodium/proline symporter PutP [Natroniella acetigena]MCK8827589.1 sodium/proline symporter PutP [Natroniella acetigena]